MTRCGSGGGRAHPRVRGDVVAPAPPAAPRWGLTPACAGTSAAAATVWLGVRAHPRVRGDVPPGRRHGRRGDRAHPRVRGDVRRHFDGFAALEGSPPRARGRPRHGAPHRCVSGLTPACAGTSARTAASFDSRRAHPRVRGDVPRTPPRSRPSHGLTPACAGTSVELERIDTMYRGSPPRARGRHVLRMPRRFTEGLTPACAGTSPLVPHHHYPPRAHPRVRGDVGSRGSRACLWRGSPPRARGRLQAERDPEHLRGLTPACAGTSGMMRQPRGTRWAHPRVRGDVVATRSAHREASGLTPACAGTSPAADFEASMYRGSPPRARGRPPPLSPGIQWNGLTPACAGTSHCGHPSVGDIGAHPRVRGDVTDAGWTADERTGSPPRARGRHVSRRLGAGARGLTPACAGTS